MPNTDSIGVCLNRLFSTMSATSPRLSSMTMRMPSLSDSSRSVAGDAVDVLLAHQLGDALEQARLVHLVRQLGDDDGLAALVVFLDVGARAHDRRPRPVAIGGGDLLRAVDDAGGREIRARHVLHQLGERDVRIVDQRDAGVDDLAQVVRRDVRGHADRDAGRAVDQQVRHARRQDRRLLSPCRRSCRRNRRSPCRCRRAAPTRAASSRTSV